MSREKSELIGKFKWYEQLTIAEKGGKEQSQNNRKVLMIHTGGTIGMFRNEEGKFAPMSAQLETFFKSHPYFVDKQTSLEELNGFFITPESIFKKRIWFKYCELPQPIDSTNMSITKMNEILSVVEQHYADFDAFVIFHGTDTMSFTASALSFMIENLHKTIVITGAQVPIGETRNDSINNALCSLTIAGHYIIPEVLLLFDNTILRGNRSTKTSASTFSAFSSPNFKPLGRLGLQIDIKWQSVLPDQRKSMTKFHRLKEEVALLKLSPFGFDLSSKAKYAVVQSYGIGNIPTVGPFNQWLRRNAKLPEGEQVVIVNISQASQSVVLNLYQTGAEAGKLGLISGSDMTCEAAVTKLSYLASLGYSRSQIQVEIQKSIRGQLTESEGRTKFKVGQDTTAVYTMKSLEQQFQRKTEKERDLLLNVINPMLAVRGSSQGVANLLIHTSNVSYIHADGGTLLHHYCKQSERERVKHQHGICSKGSQKYPVLYVLLEDVDADKEDNQGCTALFYALERKQKKYEQAECISDKGVLRVGQETARRAIRTGNAELLKWMANMGDPMEYVDYEGRDCLAYACFHKQKEIAIWLRALKPWAKVDIYGRSAQSYWQETKWTQ